MARPARIKSKSGIYHIMLRGNERRNIFHDEEDYQKFIQIINQKKQDEAFRVHAICLMSNHVHMMISEGKEDVAKVMKRITVSYVIYFNRKYQRVGHLFQDRYRSEEVEGEGYLLSLARYIHQNPVKAKIVTKVEEYPWSSYKKYLEPEKGIEIEVDTELVLNLISEDRKKARKEYIKYMALDNNDAFIDLPKEEEKMTEKDAYELYEKMLREKGQTREEKSGDLKEEIIKEFRQKTGLSVRKIAEITGLNKDKVNKITRM
jgi:REP element-mobilizing transposase RayT/DNA-binding transcriptional regulator YiaG